MRTAPLHSFASSTRSTVHDPKLHRARIRPELITMLGTSFPILLLLLPLQKVGAQTGTTAVGPPLACGYTTFSCPSGGCCNIGTCCGTGCCQTGYACINEGTSSQACCNSFDPTKCGTVAGVGTLTYLSNDIRTYAI